MKSLDERKADRKTRKTDPGPITVTDENTEFARHDQLPELLAHAALIDVNVAGENADRAEVAEAQQILTQHNRKNTAKVAKQKKSAADEPADAVNEVRKQGAQPSEEVDKQLVAGEGAGNGGGSGWKANK